MKLCYSPGACSLATRISLHEGGFDATFERVDLKAKLTQHGDDYTAINPKGYVPMLVLDDGTTVTENVAILDLLAQRALQLGPEGPLARTRLIEMLSYLSGEVHIAFKPFFHGTDDSGKAAATEAVTRRLDYLEHQMHGPYLLGTRFTVADAYLFAMLRWAKAFNLPLSPMMLDYFARLQERSCIRQSLAEEGLD